MTSLNSSASFLGGDQSVGECGALASPTISVLELICDFIFNNIYFMNLGVSVFGVYMLSLVMFY